MKLISLRELSEKLNAKELKNAFGHSYCKVIRYYLYYN